MKTRLCVVCKDILGARMILPVLPLFQERGCEISVIAEGKAVSAFKDAGIKILYDATEQKSGPLNPVAVLKKIHPTAVIVAYGSPINLEDAFAQAANQLKIPVIGFEDYWGGHRRTKARSDCIITIDTLAVSLARKSSPDAQVYIAGNPAIDTGLEIPKSVSKRIDYLRQRFGSVFMYADNGPESAIEQIDLLVSSLKKTSTSFCLIPRFHPKWIKEISASGETYNVIWNRALAPLGEQVVRVDCDRTDIIASLADITFSGLSSLMTTAVYYNKRAVSLRTPKTVEHLTREMGDITHSPLVMLGLAGEIERPTPVQEMFLRQRHLDVGTVMPYDPYRAAQAIKLFLLHSF